MKPAYDRLPQQLDQLLRLTPDGRDKRVRTATYYSDGYITPFRVDLIDAPIPGNPSDHGTTGMVGDTLTVTVTSTASPDPTDRMATWSIEERLFITYMHEFQHIIRQGLRKRLLRPDRRVPPTPITAVEHKLAFTQELYSRFEYSIFHPTISSPRANWLSNYVTLFGGVNDRYFGQGQAYCVHIYGRVLTHINRVPKGFYYQKYPRISPTIVANVQRNYDALIKTRQNLDLIP